MEPNFKKRLNLSQEDHFQSQSKSSDHADMASYKRIKREHVKSESISDEGIDVYCPIILLWGFDWEEESITPMFRTLLSPFHPIWLQTSTEMSEAERQQVYSYYPVRGDFAKVGLERAQDQDEAIEDLNYERLETKKGVRILRAQEFFELASPTAPAITSPDSSIEDEAPKKSIIVKLPPPSAYLQNLFSDRQRRLPIWINLSNAVHDARSQLRGEDLAVFEAMVAKPETGADRAALMDWWAKGGSLQ